jgi:hypothetical protein
VCRQSSYDSSSAFPSRDVPELLTRTSTPPSLGELVDHVRGLRKVAQVELPDLRAAAERADFLRGRVCAVLVAVPRDADVEPVLRELDRRCLADAGIGAGDDRDPAGRVGGGAAVARPEEHWHDCRVTVARSSKLDV